MYELLLLAFSALAFCPLAFFFGGCACCQSCANCTAIPTSYQVEISGMQNIECTDCASMDGTYVLTTPSDCGSTACVHGYTSGLSEIGCNWRIGGDRFRICLYSQNDGLGGSGGDYITNLSITTCAETGGQTEAITFNHNHGTTKPDCSAFSDLSLTYDAAATAPGACPFDKGCDGSAATVTVTAL